MTIIKIHLALCHDVLTSAVKLLRLRTVTVKPTLSPTAKRNSTANIKQVATSTQK